MTIPIDVNPWLFLPAAYLMGSFPSAYLVGKLKGVDLRTVGSGNLGATNVLRTLGWAWAAPVFLADAIKGAVPAGLLPWFIESQRSDVWALAYGAAAIAGHAKPIFLLFRGGGKGVATSAGAFLAIAPIPTAVALSVFGLVVAVSGYVSLGSMLAALSLPIAVGLSRGTSSIFFWPSVALAVFVVWTHRANIARLHRGEEHQFGRGKPDAAA